MIDAQGYLHTDENLRGRLHMVYLLWYCLRDKQMQETFAKNKMRTNWWKFIVTSLSYVCLKKARVLTPEEAAQYNAA